MAGYVLQGGMGFQAALADGLSSLKTGYAVGAAMRRCLAGGAAAGCCRFVYGSLKTEFGDAKTGCRALGGNVQRIVFRHGVAVPFAVIRHGVLLFGVAFVADIAAERALDAPHAVLFAGAVEGDSG